MLEWIADLQAPSRRRRPANKIVCPLCKSEIHVARPQDPIVMAVDFVRFLCRGLVLPAGLAGVFGCLYSGSLVYGINAIYLVFGREDAIALLTRPSESPSFVRALLGEGGYRYIVDALKVTDPFLPYEGLGRYGSLNLSLFLTGPMIAPALILSRTALADHVFAIFPIAVRSLYIPSCGIRTVANQP